MLVQQFNTRQPVFTLEDYFEGKTRAYGWFESRAGVIKRAFTVDITGSADDDGITLVEEFLYSDGETEIRRWDIKRLGAGRYEGKADGVIGLAQGRIEGNALNWRYKFALPLSEKRQIALTFDDWMYLQPDGVLVNRARVSKFGFHVGTVIISFRKFGEDYADPDRSVTDLIRAGTEASAR